MYTATPAPNQHALGTNCLCRNGLAIAGFGAIGSFPLLFVGCWISVGLPRDTTGVFVASVISGMCISAGLCALWVLTSHPSLRFGSEAVSRLSDTPDGIRKI